MSIKENRIDEIIDKLKEIETTYKIAKKCINIAKKEETKEYLKEKFNKTMKQLNQELQKELNKEQ